MDLGVAIVSWKVRDLLGACLESLFADLERSGLASGVWVVDNASTDGSAALVRERFPQAHLIENADNPGFGAANNQAFRAMGFTNAGRDSTPEAHLARIGEWGHPYDPALPFAVLCLNPDTVVRPNAVRALYDFLRARPTAANAGARLLNPDGSHQHSAFRWPGLFQAALDLFPPPPPFTRLLDTPLNGRYPLRLYQSASPFRVDFPLGAAFMVRGEALAASRSGGFDESFPLYCEEIDWSWRLARMGWDRWLVPTAGVIHYGGSSTSQNRLESFRSLWLARHHLYTRYHSRLIVLLTGLVVREAMRRRERNTRSEEEKQVYEKVGEVWR